MHQGRFKIVSFPTSKPAFFRLPLRGLGGLFFALLVCACNETECTTITDPQLRVRFQRQVRVAATATQPSRIEVRDSAVRVLRVVGVGSFRDTLVSPNQNVRTNTVQMLLPQVRDSAMYIITWRSDTVLPNNQPFPRDFIYTDSLVVSYQRRPYFVSQGCGLNYKFDSIAVKRETFTKGEKPYFNNRKRRIQRVSVTTSTADEFLQPNITILF